MHNSTPKLRFPEFTENWSIKKLGDFADVSKLAGFEFTKHIVYTDEGELIGLRGLNVKNNKLDLADVRYIDKSELHKLSRSKLYIGDLMFTYVGTVGEVALIPEDDKFYLAPNVSRIRVDRNQTLPEFINQYFLNDNFRKREINVRIATSSQPALSMSSIRQFLLSIPSANEQQKIADFLMTVDKKIETIDKKVELLKQYKKGVMQKIFSQQTRFKNINGNNYPNWESKKLVDVFDRVTTKNKKNNKNILTISAQQGLVSQTNYFNKLVAAKNVTNYYLLQRDDFAYNKSYSAGYPMGTIKRLQYYGEGVVSTLYICFRAKNSSDIDFFEHVFDFGLQDAEIEKVAQEGARNHGLLNIGIEDFFNIEMLIPSDQQERQKIADFLSLVDAKIKAAEAKLDGAKRLKKALLQRMFV